MEFVCQVTFTCPFSLDAHVHQQHPGSGNRADASLRRVRFVLLLGMS